jgi:hypothetical protein
MGQGTAVGFRLVEIAPEAEELAALLDELANSAPEVFAWFRRAPQATRERIVAVLARLVTSCTDVRLPK